jgi:hypothetical protein
MTDEQLERLEQLIERMLNHIPDNFPTFPDMAWAE